MLLGTIKEEVMIKIPAGDVKAQGQATQGMRIMNVKPEDELAAVARITWISCQYQAKFFIYGFHRFRKLTRLKSPSFVAISFIPYALQQATCNASLGRRRYSLAQFKAILDME